MLPSNYMFDVVNQVAVVLTEMAVLAAITCTAADKNANSRLH